MKFEEIQAAYEALAKEVPSICSTFKHDSYDDSSINPADGSKGVYLVDSEEPSYNFDRVKNHFDKTRKSADSLYLSSRSSSVHFFEFKNAKFHNFSDSIPSKARDSAFIHQMACSNPNSFDSPHVFTIVMSAEKNLALNGDPEAENPTSIMMRISRFFDDSINQQELSDELQRAYYCLCSADESTFPYARFEVILSSRFNRYLSNA